MRDDSVRGFGRAFCDAWMKRQPQDITPYLDEDIEWTVFGPVDLFPFVGRRRGKRAVINFCEQVADTLQLKDCEPEIAVGDSDSDARLMRLTAEHPESGRTLSFRMAQFGQFKDGKLVRMMALFDSFDAAEQVLGRNIDLSRKILSDGAASLDG